MPEAMVPQTFPFLLDWIIGELEYAGSIFGIPKALFYLPEKDDPYARPNLFGHYLATPVGPAAGPHTQLAQNIVAAWLCGGRFIELKTVQIMDELEIPRPCIDMEDEGYNVEWSQELRLPQSADEYIKAWVLVHVLHCLLGMEGPVGTIFNMSVGYNLEGIQSPPMVRFMDRLQDATPEVEALRMILRDRLPQLAEVEIPGRVTDNVTLSTMHGCPPDEIGRIARYLLEERGLHTTVKLNPTLLGPERVRHILHDELGFEEIDVPDVAFEHDLKYDRALELIRSLQETAARQGLDFGVKLSNTLEVVNRKGHLPGDEMYMSGRALYPITMNLFNKLSHDFRQLNVSYSAGADALNVATILSCGARTVTAASDLLKPGGYGRMHQYLEKLEEEMRARGAGSLEDLAKDRLGNLERAAAEALQNERYKKSYFTHGLPKVDTGLGLFDCITAPCRDQCAVCQDVPAYARLIAQGEYDRALEVILDRNPLPGVTGYVCTHLCQARCTRNNYEEPVAIRALKRFAVERGQVEPRPAGATARRVAVIGAGPSGLAAAYYLALSGVQVTIFEAREKAGGMLALAPSFRLPAQVVADDIERVRKLGVQIELSHPITVPPEELLKEGFDAVYVATGFQQDARLAVPGIEGEGVYSALDLLRRVANGEEVSLGERVLVIGGGNTAMDAARTARRLVGRPVTVVYRRTRSEMPAEPEEVADLLAEGNVLVELATPRQVVREDGRVKALECVRNRLGEPGPDGRREPAPVEGSEFLLPADSVVVAVGQKADVAFLGGSLSLHRDGAIQTGESGQTNRACVFAGGDAVRGPAIIVQACADGRQAAEAIAARLGIPFAQPPARPTGLTDEEVMRVKGARARKEEQHRPEVLPPERRGGFELVEQTLSEEAARAEAARCLQCATFCDKCVEVCPNRANYTFKTAPVHWTLPLLAARDGRLAVVGEEPFAVEQGRQIVHVDEFCNECGNCAAFCVHQGRPFMDKPRLFLQRAAFEQEEDNAFYLAAGIIGRREGGRESSLTVGPGGLIFESEAVRLVLSPDMQLREAELKAPFSGMLSLRPVAEMAVILRGVTETLPFLAR